MLTPTSRVATRDHAADLATPSVPPPLDIGALCALPAAHAPHPDRRHRQDDGRRDHPAAPDRHREGARHLRMDRRQHVPRSEDGRLRHRRHPLHAGVEQPGRQVRRPECAVRRPRARGRAFRRAMSTDFASRKSEHGLRQPRACRPTTPRRRSTAAPRSISSAIGWVPVDPADVRKVVLEEPPGNLPLDRRESGDRPRTAVRVVGDELDRLQLRARRRAARVEARRPVPYLMYPQGETANGRLDSLDPEAFSYEISVREVDYP